ncbi:uncharacterized protein METZ01_LOCUS187673 [marine metagenome]|uniref:DSP-PTPase phosphatase fused to NAD+ Kinase domain-containing protein n=1 Tax=marine metagenome TaxID=408172 RepID=A0A382D9K5_9ZZZZ
MNAFSRYALTGICIVLTSMPSFVLGQEFRGEQPPEADIQNSFDRSTYLDGITSLGQPSAAGLADLARAGNVAVIDLRGPDEERGLEERAAVEELGMEYVSLPITGTTNISYENAARLRQIIGEFNQPVAIHCASGNRVGALLALGAKLNGAEDGVALSIGRDNGLTSLESTVLQKLKEKQLIQ